MGEETDIGSQSVGGQVNAGVMTCLDISREPADTKCLLQDWASL